MEVDAMNHVPDCFLYLLPHFLFFLFLFLFLLLFLLILLPLFLYFFFQETLLSFRVAALPATS